MCAVFAGLLECVTSPRSVLSRREHSEALLLDMEDDGLAMESNDDDMLMDSEDDQESDGR